jgi:ATP-binding cassette subfamily C protein LapB
MSRDSRRANDTATAPPSFDSDNPRADAADETVGPIPFSLWRSSTMRGLVAAMVVGQGRLLAALAAAGLIGNLLFVALPIFSMAVYDKVVPHNASETMIALSIGVMLALVTDFGLRAVRTKLSDALALRVQVDFTSRALERLLEMRMADAPRDPASLLMALRDLEGFCQILPALFVSLAIDILFVVAICVFLTLIGGYVGLVPLIGIVMLVVV